MRIASLEIIVQMSTNDVRGKHFKLFQKKLFAERYIAMPGVPTAADTGSRKTLNYGNNICEQ